MDKQNKEKKSKYHFCTNWTTWDIPCLWCEAEKERQRAERYKWYATGVIVTLLIGFYILTK